MLNNSKTFTCDWSGNRGNFYKSANAILGTIGLSQTASVLLHLIKTICYPMLLYGVPSFTLSKRELNQFTFAYNSIFAKIFKTNDASTIELCQFYTNILPFCYAYDLLRFNFLIKANLIESCNYEMRKTNSKSLQSLCLKYNLNISDAHILKTKIWEHFETYLNLQ